MVIQPDFRDMLALLNSHKVEYGDVPVHFLGRDQYAANKKAIGRKKDLADLEAIGEE